LKLRGLRCQRRSARRAASLFGHDAQGSSPPFYLLQKGPTGHAAPGSSGASACWRPAAWRLVMAALLQAIIAASPGEDGGLEAAPGRRGRVHRGPARVAERPALRRAGRRQARLQRARARLGRRAAPQAVQRLRRAQLAREQPAARAPGGLAGQARRRQPRQLLRGRWLGRAQLAALRETLRKGYYDGRLTCVA